MSAHAKNLLKLLRKHGYECEENGLGYRVYRRPGCRDVDLYPQSGKAACERFTRQVQHDIKWREPEPENDWEAAERKRAADQTLREAADAARVKNTRLGGASAVLTEAEVDAVARCAERDMADRRELERLVREMPLGAGRRR